MPKLPRPILPALLALTVVAFLPQLSSGAAPFPQDLEPISIVGRECKCKVCCVAMVTVIAGVHVIRGDGHKGVTSHHWETPLRVEDVFKATFAKSKCLQGWLCSLDKNQCVYLFTF